MSDAQAPAVPAKLGSIANVEEVINEFARGLARKKGVRESCFRVHLVESIKGRGDMMVLPGSLVQIQLQWPMPFALAKGKLASALNLIKSRSLHTPLAVATHAYFQREGVATRKWAQKNLEKVNVADVVEELIPLHRVRVTRSVVVTYTDTLTGATVSVTETQAPEPYRSQYINEWLTLSRLANSSVAAPRQGEVAPAGSEAVSGSASSGPESVEAGGVEDSVGESVDHALLEDGGAE